MDAMKQFSPKLKAFREETGLNQSQLADKLGVSRGSISFYENGDRIPDIEFLRKVSEYFNVSADWLLGLSNVQSNDGELQQACNYTGLSEDAIKNILIAHGVGEKNNTAFNAMSFINKFFESIELYKAMRYLFRAVYADSMRYKPAQLLRAKADKTQEEQDLIDGFREDEKRVIELLEEDGNLLLEGSEAAEYYIFKAKESITQIVNDVFSSSMEEIDDLLLPHIPK